jgi:hypothetical protein
VATNKPVRLLVSENTKIPKKLGRSSAVDGYIFSERYIENPA